MITACLDWEERLINKESIIPPPIFPNQAEKALAIFKNLKITDIAGKPTFGQASLPWVFDFVSAIFGAYDAETGQQKIREFLLLISKKNTKSTIAAGIMLTALILCWRENEEHLIIAPTKEVAENSFIPAAAMIREDPFLQEMFKVRNNIKTIEHRLNGNKLKVVSADKDVVSGKKAGIVLIDELWAFGDKPNADGMLMEASGGLISRPEGFIIYLTTQSDTPPAGVFREKLNYFRKVRDGIVKDSTVLPVLYEFPKKMLENKDFLKPENFYITNPNLGKSVDESWLNNNLQKILLSNDSSKQKFFAKHLNVEINITLQDDNWAGAEVWLKACKEITLNEILKRSGIVTVGIDGGGLDDLLAVYIIGKDKNNQWYGWGRAWASEIVLKRRKAIAPRLLDFKNIGELEIVEHIGEDIESLVKIITEIENMGILDKIGCDPAGIGNILDKIEEAGVAKEKIVGVSQGWRLGGAIKTAERRLADGSFTPAKQQLMDWTVGNAKVEQRANSILVTKQASGYAKIDTLMALFNAVTLMALNPESSFAFDSFISDF